MSDFSAGPPSGGHDGGSDTRSGGPPPVLLAALAVAALIAVGLIAAFASLSGGDGGQPEPDRPGGATATTDDERILLTVSVGGSGIGRVRIIPSDVSCSTSCEYKFRAGRRVTATAEPSTGSTFEGWNEACSGERRCSFVMDRQRGLSATFAEKPAADPLCEGVPPEEQDPTCPLDEPGTSTQPREPGPDCLDGRDNDDDGLTDTQQDPDCEESGSESGASAPPGGSTSPSSPTPPPAVVNECTDGRDNDDDGLTDREQDPDCEKGRSESG